jgi:hypothetical protein
VSSFARIPHQPSIRERRVSDLNLKTRRPLCGALSNGKLRRVGMDAHVAGRDDAYVHALVQNRTTQGDEAIGFRVNRREHGTLKVHTSRRRS